VAARDAGRARGGNRRNGFFVSAKRFGCDRLARAFRSLRFGLAGQSSSTPTAPTWQAAKSAGWPARSVSWAIAWRCSHPARSRWFWSQGRAGSRLSGGATPYLLMAALMAVGVLAVLWGEEPSTAPAAPRTLREAVIEPLREYFSRPKAGWILVLLVLYKLGDAFRRVAHNCIPIARCWISLEDVAT